MPIGYNNHANVMTNIVGIMKLEILKIAVFGVNLSMNSVLNYFTCKFTCKQAK